ncbi:Crp/Fnr family transcriptional regulator [Rubrobacter calidifluminis]|uniref:Crp/Fnr family transcriptional regulator n=1 Tax=Rubrobacter calidifluminis TaxID=1392640 RepID=UPI00235E7BEA|nr:Crp/Fnr family transcriptional regulator [Rubrobacter calidifluminis]
MTGLETSGSLREAEWRRVMEAATGMGFGLSRRHHERGEPVYRDEEPADGLYVITTGAVMVTREHSGGKEATVRILGPWDHFGHALFPEGTAGDLPVQTHARVCSGRCEVVKIPRIFLRKACSVRPGLVLSLVTLDNLRLAEQQEMSRCLLPRRVRSRLLELFPILISKFGAACEDPEYMEIVLHLTHHDLAGMVSASRESVTVALAELCREGVVRTSRGRLQVRLSRLQGFPREPAPTPPATGDGIE